MADPLSRITKNADRTPAFEHGWLFDNFAPIQGSLDGPCFEGWTRFVSMQPHYNLIFLED